jgi:hypothetical protein
MRPHVRKAGPMSVFGAKKDVSFEIAPKAGKELRHTDSRRKA